MPLVVGLGNPGSDYADTRHNLGFRVVELLAERWRARSGPKRNAYRTWRAAYAGRDVTLLEPLTYMNLSGEAITAWAGRHVLERSELLVVADDVYLPVGVVRIRGAGSSGGHQGLESVERAVGSRQYARLRIGVGAVPGGALKQHVLEEPRAEERVTLERAVERGAEAVEVWLEAGLGAAMNRFNRRVREEEPET